MTEKEKRKQRQTAEDAIFNRMLLWLVGAIIAEAVVLFVKRFYVDVTPSDFDFAMMTGMFWFFKVFAIAGLVLTVLGVVWCVLWAKKKKALRAPAIVTGVVAFFWILSVLARLLSDVGVKIMMVLPIVAAVLILIYFLYTRAFFVNTIIAGCGMAALWGFRQFYEAHTTAVTALYIVGWVCLAAIAVLSIVLKKNHGKLGKLQIVNDQKSYPVCWLTCAVVFVATLLALILGVAVAYYLLYALIGWLFCLAVFFTVKLV